MLTRRVGWVQQARSPLSDGGASLVELVVAIGLLAVALVGLAASFPASMYAVTQGGLQTTATGLAQQTIEDAKHTPYGNLPGLAATRAAIAGFNGFDRQVLVADYAPATGCAAVVIAGTTIPGCRQVTVRVFFTGQQGEVQTTVTTVIARP